MTRWLASWLVIMIGVTLVGLCGILSSHAMIELEVRFGMLSRNHDWEFVALSYGIPLILLCIGLTGIVHGIRHIKQMRRSPTP